MCCIVPNKVYLCSIKGKQGENLSHEKTTSGETLIKV